MARQILHPDPIVVARQSDDKVELFTAFRFKVSRIESTGAILIENERRLGGAVFSGFLALGLSYPFLLVVSWVASGKEFTFEKDDLFGRIIEVFFLSVIFGTFLGGLCVSAFTFFHCLCRRRILIDNQTFRFEGMPLSGFVVDIDQVEAVYVTTDWWRRWWCKVAFAIRNSNRTRLLGVHVDPLFYPRGLENEKEQIVAHRPLAKLLKRIVRKPAKLQKGSDASQKRHRAYWR